MGITEDFLARNRIMAFLDENSFVELGAHIVSRSSDSGMDSKELCGDGVITGYGQLGGHLIYIYAQEPKVLGGTLGEMHCRKIAEVYQKAAIAGAPVVGLLDSTGLRLKEGTRTLSGFGLVLKTIHEASGAIPLFTVIAGNCGGGLSLLPAISDFSYMIKTTGKLFVNSPNTLPENYQEKLDTAGADFQSANSGITDICESMEEAAGKISQILNLIPGNWQKSCSFGDDLNRKLQVARGKEYKFDLLVGQLADQGTLVELKKDYGSDFATCLAMLGDMPVGIIGNRAQSSKESRLTPEGLGKGKDFITFCDAFDIPILFITDTEGFDASVHSEKSLAREMASFTCGLLTAQVPKITLIPKCAYGTAGVLMNAKALGADLVIGWMDAKVGTMASELAKKVLDCDIADSIEEAAADGMVDMIISPEDTRKYLISSLDMLAEKQDPEWKKHSAK